MKPGPDLPIPEAAPTADDRIEDAAADWLARRETGFTVEEQAAFSRWLLADPRHAEAVQQLESAWRFLSRPRYTGQAGAVARTVEARASTRSRSRRLIAAFSLGGLAAAAALVFLLAPARRDDPAPAEPAATVAYKPERRTLADGTVVEFNSGAEIEVAYTAARRDVRLVRGEAHFAVTKNPARPFVVTAGPVRVRAVGTAFAVRFDPEAVGVLVTEGRVAVERQADATEPPAEPVAPTYLAAGSSLTVPTAASAGVELTPRVVSEAELRVALAWRGMRVEFTNTPLSDIVALFNRQNHVQLALGDPGLADIRISGVFWADDPEGFSRLIESSAGLQAIRTMDERIELRPPRIHQ